MRKYLWALVLLAAAMQQAQAADFLVTAFGAKGDGKTLASPGIQKAIDKAAAAGGGRVVVPAGTFLSGTIFIRSNVTLYLSPSAVIFGSPNIKHYVALKQGHNIDRQPYHLIVADSVQNAGLAGPGTVNGNGTAFFKDHENKEPRWILAKPVKVSPMVEFRACTNVKVQEVTLTNPAGWTLHLHDCERVLVDGIRIDNNIFTPNSDGIDITGGSDIQVSNCYVKTCDDGICLKTTPDSKELKRVTVTNCVVQSNCVALKLGCNESFKNISQVTFSNCVVHHSSRAIGLYSKAGGTFEDVTFTNIVADTKSPTVLNRPIHISLFADPGFTPGRIRNITISNFTCQTEGRIILTAENGSMLENITLRDVKLGYAYVEDFNLFAPGNTSNQFSKANPKARQAPGALVAENVRNLVVENFQTNWPAPDAQIGKDWQYPERIEHGGLRVFQPSYKPLGTNMSAIWGHNLKGGYIDAPLATPTSKDMPVFSITGSDIVIRQAK